MHSQLIAIPLTGVFAVAIALAIGAAFFIRRANARLQRAFIEWRRLVSQAPISMAMLDRQMFYLATSERWVQEFGREQGSPVGCCHYDIHPDIPDRWKDIHRRALAGECVKCDEELWVHADGVHQWLAWAVSPWRNETGEIGGIIIIVEDITPRKHLQYLAHHDPLTGLANRSLLALRLRHTIERARRDGGRCAVLYLDLDGFKAINDRLGHDAGDDVLRRVARRMVRPLRDVDTLARLGGDEFVLVLEQLSADADAEDVARAIILRLTRWFRLNNGEKVSIGVSVGISVYPDDGQDADTLLRRADAALYLAKSAGRGTMKFAHELVSS